MSFKLRQLGAALLLFSLAHSVAAEEVEVDPWEGFNRGVFAFNEGLDRYLLKPVTLGYKAVTPDLIETGISNFFDNISDIGTLFNNLLQGKPTAAAGDFARLTFNTSFGLLGFIDVATPMGIEKHDEDFGQTLGVWGADSGPYLVLPFFGPSSVRDGIGLAVDSYASPYREIEDDETRYAVLALRTIDTRAGLLEAEKLITGDKYLFIRDAYLQRRAFVVSDGQVQDFNGDNF